jgi:hypothetical protein
MDFFKNLGRGLAERLGRKHEEIKEPVKTTLLERVQLEDQVIANMASTYVMAVRDRIEAEENPFDPTLDQIKAEVYEEIKGYVAEVYDQRPAVKEKWMKAINHPSIHAPHDILYVHQIIRQKKLMYNLDQRVKLAKAQGKLPKQ